jgi:hypothetical protein
MANLSIRNLPAALEQAIQQEAKKRDTTKTDVVVETLMAAFHLTKGNAKIHRDIRGFFGKMTRKEYLELKKHTADFSTVDAEMWK